MSVSTLPTTPEIAFPFAGSGEMPTAGRNDGGDVLRIEGYDSMPPFFCTLTSDADVWMFVSSTGGMTAGRRDADEALLPYETVDRIHDGIAHTGPVALVRWKNARGEFQVWEPFAGRPANGTRRSLSKTAASTRMSFEEALEEEGLSFVSTLMISPRFGVVRECRLRNLGDRSRSVEVLHGMRNLLPSGITRQTQNEFSCLLDAYKQSELLERPGIGVFSLASGLTDLPKPFEVLRATVAWSAGLPSPRRSVDLAAIAQFRDGGTPQPRATSRGVRANYLEWAHLDLAPRSERRWFLVADTGLDQPAVSRLAAQVEAGNGVECIERDVAAGEASLLRRLAAADAQQCTGDATASVHHVANVLFNIMRGGTFPEGYTFRRDDFARFVRGASRSVAERHAGWLAALPESISRQELRKAVLSLGCPQLERIFLEYLPLSFSRRHGDPSRPWNRFRIETRDAEGRDLLAFQGNWRDIFQNWEALALSFPEYLESMIAKFVNASTVDGHNPYRISRDGIDWEEPEPDNPWAAYGYWGDHQIVYLLKLLEAFSAHYPGAVEGWLGARRFAYANVPYRLREFDRLLANPRDTITFEAPLSASLRRRAAADGSDAKLVCGEDGEPVLVSLLEKLLVPMLAKWSSFVPGGGIWMNTQRPEWNDANNALAGYGLSVVTLCYLRRQQAWLLGLLRSVHAQSHELSATVATWVADVHAALGRARDRGDAQTSAGRLALMRDLGLAGQRHRERSYDRPFAGERAVLPHAELIRLLEELQIWADETLRLCRRPDGLFHSYNLLSRRSDGVAVLTLDPMLEGQVAVLSSGLLATEEVIDLLESLKASPLRCPQRRSYLLYPDRPLKPFLAKNRIAAQDLRTCAFLERMLVRADHRIVCPDGEGSWRFQADLHNEEDLLARLKTVSAPGSGETPSAGDVEAIRALYEHVFHHHAFTGRSGSMFAYEGLGSIYWHMVSKLLLAIQENLVAARGAGASPELLERLDSHYEEVRNGLGFRKTAREYGAFPTDPYSHTPAHAGAQQPGMTGQVKEELLTRRVELGAHVRAGRIHFEPVHRLADSEFLAAEAVFRTLGKCGEETSLHLPAGSLAFTLCQTPVVCRRIDGATPPHIRVHLADGTCERCAGNALDPQASRKIFQRDPQVSWLEVFLPA